MRAQLNCKGNVEVLKDGEVVAFADSSSEDGIFVIPHWRETRSSDEAVRLIEQHLLIKDFLLYAQTSEQSPEWETFCEYIQEVECFGDPVNEVCADMQLQVQHNDSRLFEILLADYKKLVG